MKIINREFFKTFRKAVAFSLFITVLTVLFARILTKEMFTEVFFWTNFLVYGVPLLFLFFFLLKDYKYFDTKKQSLQYSVYQRNSIAIFLGFIFQIRNVMYPEEQATSFLAYFSGEKTAINFYLMILAGTILTAYSIFGFLNLLQHQKIVSKLKNQLKKAN